MTEDFQLPTLYGHHREEFIIIAHRGASAYYPENTMAAFKGALSIGADMIELDVMLSKDGIPVVFHDARLNAHTNGRGLLSNYPLKDLKQLDAGAWFSSKFAGEGIPTLEEVLAFASGKIALNIEIKTEAVTDDLKNGVEEKCLKLVKKYGMKDHVLFSSFDYRAISHLKEMSSSLPVALLYNKRMSGGRLPHELIAKYRADAFNCTYYQLNRKRLANLKEHRIPTFIYTVNNKRKMKKLLSKGVAGIFTNKPDVLGKLVKAMELSAPFFV